MKKLFSLLLALAMCVSLAACGGGVDKQPAIDAHNVAGAAVNDLTTLINANPEPYAEYISDMNDLVAQLNECGAFLESDEKTTQEALDQWVKTCNDIEKWAKDAKAEIEAAAVPAEPDGSAEPAGDGEASGLDYFVGTWSLCGGVSNDTEWTEDDLNATLEMYGGKLDVAIGADGSAQMVQGGGTLSGACQPVDADGAVGLYMTIDSNGTTLEYAGDLLSTEDGDILLSLTPDGVTSMYFIQGG